MAFGALSVLIWFGFILFNPSNWIINQQPDSPLHMANLVMLVALFLLQIFVLIGTISATRSTLKAKNPIPVRPPRNLRVAFATTRAPGEPVAMVRTTLEAALRAKTSGNQVDVWLLDETHDPQLIQTCIDLGVKYFSRSGIAKWNTPKHKPQYIKRLATNALWLASFGHTKRFAVPAKPDPYLAGKSKHGNFNAWRAYLKREAIEYDILAGVDTDQVPEPNFLERLLGYFRDPNVAYVVGPQVYGNYRSGLKGLVSRLAESQASFFQSTIQRAGNDSASPMFVGTNYAVRMSVLDQINGFQPCITEDMATGLAIHSRRNPATGKRWKSIYTPDVLAVGEGPDTWGPFFTQQWRWAAGTFDTWRKVVWRIFYKLSPGALIHYFLMLTYYPIAALTWLLSIVSSLTYLFTGATAILAPWAQFISLYLMFTVMQLSLYFWNRRFNVSPHEPPGSYGISGMFASTLMSPIYFSALLGILLGKKPNFVVTVKGSEVQLDSLGAFSTHIRWALLIAGALIYGLLNGHDHPAMMVWAVALLVITLTPVALGMTLVAQYRLNKLRTQINKYLTRKPEKTNA